MRIRWSQIALGVLKGSENVIQMDSALRSDVGVDHHILITYNIQQNVSLHPVAGEREGSDKRLGKQK